MAGKWAYIATIDRNTFMQINASRCGTWILDVDKPPPAILRIIEDDTDVETTEFKPL
jgi:hypothetical protein